MDKTLVVFQDKNIRRIWHNEEWFFSVVDMIFALDASTIPKRYWSDLKNKIQDQEGFELYDKIVQLKLPSTDGKSYLTDCANTESMFRIIQSIPSKKAEPFKIWLAKVGYERIQETENPELAQKHMRELYKTIIKIITVSYKHYNYLNRNLKSQPFPNRFYYYFFTF